MPGIGPVGAASASTFVAACARKREVEPTLPSLDGPRGALGRAAPTTARQPVPTPRERVGSDTTAQSNFADHLRDAPAAAISKIAAVTANASQRTAAAGDQVTSLLRSPPEEAAVPALLLSVIGSLGHAGLLLDYRGRVLFLNEMAQCCIGDGLTLRGERLAATDHESDSRLQHLIALAVASTGSPLAIMSVGVQRACKRPLLVRVVRLEENARPALNSAALLIVVLDPEIYPEPSPDILKQAFAFTPTEAKVATGIIRGRNLAEISRDLGVKAGTVRTHLKSVFSKTRLRGQAELVGLLTRVAFVIPHRLRSAAVVLVSESASIGEQRREAAGRHSSGFKSQGVADHLGAPAAEPPPAATTSKSNQL